MRQISDLTYQVVAFSEVSDIKPNVCIDWAFEMVSLGYDTPTLLILAALDKPGNYFQVIVYLKDALKELDLKVKTGDDAIVSYSHYFIHRISIGDNTKENLTTLYRFCQSKNYEKLVYDFYLLWWAWDDLDYGNEFQHYWEGANKDNIEEIVRETAVKWLKENNTMPIL